MNLPRYRFSRESEKELLEFFKAAMKHKPSETNETNIWKSLLPVDKELQEKFSSMIPKLDDEVMEIIDSDDEVKIEVLLGKSPSSLHTTLTPSESETNPNTTAVEDMIDGIQELLQTESALDETVIKKIGNEFSVGQLQDMFMSFGNIFDSKCMSKMWKSLASANSTEERNIIVPYFIEYVLIEKILKEHNNFTEVVFKEVFEEFPNEIISAVTKVLFERNKDVDYNIFRNNLSCLSDDQKSNLLSTFRHHCQELEPHHISIILSLLTPSSNGEILTKIIELMCQSAKEFSSDKIFGKLLLEITQTLGPNVVRCEQQLKYIVLNHKSVFKAKIVKLLDCSLQEHKILSQSFSM